MSLTKNTNKETRLSGAANGDERTERIHSWEEVKQGGECIIVGIALGPSHLVVCLIEFSQRLPSKHPKNHMLISYNTASQHLETPAETLVEYKSYERTINR